MKETTPGGGEQGEVGSTDGAVPVQVALRVVGDPAGEQIPEVLGVHLVVPTVHVGPTVVAPGIVIVAAEVDE